jgi:hypothetical protein
LDDGTMAQRMTNNPKANSHQQSHADDQRQLDDE